MECGERFELITNKLELDEEILKVCHEMGRPSYIEHYLEISDWFATLITFPFKRKWVSDFFFAGLKG